jgi:hypothetical protein
VSERLTADQVIRAREALDAKPVDLLLIDEFDTRLQMSPRDYAAIRDAFRRPQRAADR